MPLNPGGYFPMRPSPGQAPRSAQAPSLGNESALSGLRSAAESQPWQQRSRAIGSIGSSGRPQDLALASQLGDRYNRDYADPSIDETEAAMQSLHPAAQAAEEARAMRGAYPAQEAAYGQVESAKAS